MALILFVRTIALPVGAIRKQLERQLPLYRWRVGEDDDGSADAMTMVRPHQLVMGRSEIGAVAIELIARDEPLDAPAPPHRWQLEIGRPTIDDDTLAQRATLLVCAALMAGDADDSRCQLAPGGNWLSSDDVARLLNAIQGGESLATIAAALGVPPAHLAGAPEPTALPTVTASEAVASPVASASRPALPPPPRRVTGFGRKGL